MSISDEGLENIHRALTTYAAGGRARPVKGVGKVTDEQFLDIKKYFGKMGRKFKSQDIDVLSKDIIHYYRSKMERDGMDVDEVIVLLKNAFDDNAKVVPEASNRSDRATLVNDSYHGVINYTDNGTISLVTAIKK